jgi:hypothetical protein
LGVPKVLAGTGLEISPAVFDALESWELLDKTQAFVFDTTASKTGRYNSACTLLENKLNRDIIYFGCRHHIFEIVLADIFRKCEISPLTGPDIPLFKRFKAKWYTINFNKFVTRISYIDIKIALGNNYIDIVEFAKLKLLTNSIRDDYKELLFNNYFFGRSTYLLEELSLKYQVYTIMQGGWPKASIVSKYTQHDFKLTNNEINYISHFNLFLIKCYDTLLRQIPMKLH